MNHQEAKRGQLAVSVRTLACSQSLSVNTPKADLSKIALRFWLEGRFVQREAQVRTAKWIRFQFLW